MTGSVIFPVVSNVSQQWYLTEIKNLQVNTNTPGLSLAVVFGSSNTIQTGFVYVSIDAGSAQRMANQITGLIASQSNAITYLTDVATPVVSSFAQNAGTDGVYFILTGTAMSNIGTYLITDDGTVFLIDPTQTTATQMVTVGIPYGGTPETVYLYDSAGNLLSSAT